MTTPGTLAELRAAGEPIARRIVDLLAELAAAQRELATLVGGQREAAAAAIERGATARAAEIGYEAALMALAECRRGVLTVDQASWRIAVLLGLRDLHNSPAAQELPAERRIDLLLEQRFEAVMKGN